MRGELRREFRGQVLAATDAPDSPLVDRFYAGYDRAFVLAEEKESLAGFRACLELNDTPVAASFGRRHRECVAVLETTEGELLAGANLLATRMLDAAGPPVSVSLNYLFVEPHARGRGLARAMVAAVADLANEMHGLGPDAPPPAIFIEQNDPLRRTAEESAADTAHTGLDQFDRLRIWAHLGARVVDFPYVQPALTPAQEPDFGLVYAALQFPGSAVAPAYLHDHLESFFGVSVLKGRNIDADEQASDQLRALHQRTTPVALLALGRALDELGHEPPSSGPSSLLEYLHGRGG